MAEKIIERDLIKVFGDNIGEFKQMMEKSGCVISGSFVLQALMNEKWDGDIDIFAVEDRKTIGNNPSTMFEDFIHASKHNKYNQYDKHTEDDYGDKFSNGKMIIQIREYRMCGKVFEIIIVNCEKEKLKDYIHNNFDFDILKNVCYVKDGEFKIDVLFPQNIKDKEFEFKYQKDVIKSIERADKYISRGFNVTFKNKPFNKYEIVDDIAKELNINKYIGSDENNIKPTRFYFYKTDKNLDAYDHSIYESMKSFKNVIKNDNPVETILDEIMEVYRDKKHSRPECDNACCLKNKPHTHIRYDTGYFNLGAYNEIIVMN